MVLVPRAVHIQAILRAAVSWTLIAVLLCLPLPAQADLLLSTEAELAYEDNIVGLLTGAGPAPSGGLPGGATAMQAGAKGFGSGPGSGTGGGQGSYIGAGSRSPGDLSITVMAEAGYSGDAGGDLTFLALGYAERTDYQEFSEYDQTAAGVSAGAALRMSDVFEASLSGSGEARRFDNDPDRDGSKYSGTAGLKYAVADDLRLRGSALYESYRAVYQDFSYRGPAYRIAAAYDLTDDLLVKAGIRFQSRQYQDTAATVLRTSAALLGSGYDLTDRWSAWLTYERQRTHPGTSDVITRSNIYSLALRWDY